MTDTKLICRLQHPRKFILRSKIIWDDLACMTSCNDPFKLLDLIIIECMCYVMKNTEIERILKLITYILAKVHY